jgi:hypothetical protein
MELDRATGRWDEVDRLKALENYDILDTEREQAFEDIAKVAALVCNAPISVINFLAKDRQWFKAEIGLGMRETPRDISICTHAIFGAGTFCRPRHDVGSAFQGQPARYR